MHKNYYYIANWKMFFSHNEVVQWFQENGDQLLQLSQNNSIIVCPSYESLAEVGRAFHGTSLAMGAQNCSESLKGAYTGQVSAQSLKELGVSYCLVGHSEVRDFCGDSNKQLEEKLKRLVEKSITPIFCIGESKTEYEEKNTQYSIENQLAPLIAVYSKTAQPCFIAYEPIWAIGTGVVAHSGHITQVLAIVKSALKACVDPDLVRYLYGGTVTSKTISGLKTIEALDGFLIGSASINFQELKKIVV